jgi:hypothetical protein
MRNSKTHGVYFFLMALIPTGMHAQTSPPPFLPPHALTVTDIPYPNQVNAAGLVSLELQIDVGGKVTDIAVLRDIPGLTDLAKSAVQKWTFAPGTLKGQPVVAPLTVEVVFNTGILRADNLNVPPPSAFVSVGDLSYTPPVVETAAFANYPFNSVAWGAVVLGVRIDTSGKIFQVHDMRDVPSLTEPSISAVKAWTFSSGTFQNNPVASRAVVAFVFRAAFSAAP